MLRVGAPKEIKPQEFRVGLTPEAVSELVRQGSVVIIEADAGAGIDASDAEYKAAGADIAPTAEEVFARADLIIKVKEPQPAEIARLTDRHMLFTYLHLAADRAQADGLVASGCTAIAYETVTDHDGGLPLLAPMSEVAGRLTMDAAQNALRRHLGGAGKLLSGVPGVPPARVIVIGGGVAGTQAARMALGLGADVLVLDNSSARLRILDGQFGGRLQTRYSTLRAIEEEVVRADVVIGAVLVAGASAPQLIKRDLIAKMRPGSVLVDVAIDQGGISETSRPTTHADPTYIVDRVVHYCVANMPGAVPKTSTYALNNSVLPFALRLASQGLQVLRSDSHLRAGVNVHRGKITHRAVADTFGLKHTPVEVALS